MKNIFKNLFTKKYYWYEVRFIYKDKKGNKEILNFVMEVGLTNQKDILNYRLVKKSMRPLHTGRLKDYKRYLVNGVLNIEVMCYLGRFSQI